MSIQFKTYVNCSASAFAGYQALVGTTKLYVALMDATYEANIDQIADSNWGNVVAYDIDTIGSPTNYTVGGKALTGVTISQVDGSPSAEYIMTIDADDISFKGLTATFKVLVLYYSNGAGALSPLLGYAVLPTAITATNQTFTIRWSSFGIIEIIQYA